MKKILSSFLLLAFIVTVSIGQNPVIFYQMDQPPFIATNAVSDATGNTTATLTYNSSNTALPIYRQGGNNDSYASWDFSNTDGYILVPSNATTTSLGNTSTTTGLTIGFWVNLEYDHSLHNNHRIAGLNGVVDIALNGNGIVFLLDGATHQIQTLPAGTVLQGGWEHITLTLDFTTSTNNLKWFHNGVLMGSESTSVTNAFNNGNPLVIGARSSQSYYFPGELDDFIIFDEALNDAQVLDLYNNGGESFCPSCTAATTAVKQGGFTYRWADYDNSDTEGLGSRAVNFDVTGTTNITHVPPVGVHPRIYFCPSEIPDIKNRLENTESGKTAAALIHAYTTLLHKGYLTGTSGGTYNHNDSYGRDNYGERWVDNAGKWDSKLFYYQLIAEDATVFDDPRLEAKRHLLMQSIMALEAFECLINKGGFDPDTGLSYDDRAADLAKAQTFLASQVLLDPTVGIRNYGIFYPAHMGLTYDLNYHAMTDAQRDITRQALAQITDSRPLYGEGLHGYVNLSNWNGLNSFELLANLAIEGEAGYKPELTHSWLRNFHNFITYGWYDSGAGNEGLGKNYQFATTMIAAAKRGYSLLGHPKVRAYGTNFLPAVMQPFGHSFTSYDVWGGSGPDHVIGGYKPISTDPVGLKWIFPNDPTVDFIWQNYIDNGFKSSKRYVYQPIEPAGYINFLLPAAIFALDYDDTQDFDTEAASIIQTDFFAPDRGLAVMRSGTDSTSLASQFHCRQDMGGHTHGDRLDFTLSGLGRIWVRKTFGGSPFMPTYFHSCVLIDDLGIGVELRDGKKCRQPGKVLDYQSGNDITCVTGDATYAYTWEWYWNPTPPGQPNRKEGTENWEPVTETWNDFQYNPKSEAHYNIPFYDYPHWATPGTLERMVKQPYNPMERVVRTVGMVKGQHPFMLVVDDVEKDDNVHNYKWVAQIANDLEVENFVVNLDDCRYRNDIILKEPDATGNRRLLVRVLNSEGFDGSTDPGFIEPLEYIYWWNGESYNERFRQRLVVESNSIAPDFRVLLYPYYDGDELPETSWNATRDSLVVRFSDEENVIALNPQEGGRWNKIEVVDTRPIDQVQISAKAYLQGPLASGMMKANLADQNLLPSTEPFTAQGYTHYGEGGGESMVASATTQTGNNQVMDWVVIELRDAASPSTILATCAALLQRDGDIVDVDGVSPVTFRCTKADDYHVAVRHRNHLGVMTALPVFLN